MSILKKYQNRISHLKKSLDGIPATMIDQVEDVDLEIMQLIKNQQEYNKTQKGNIRLMGDLSIRETYLNYPNIFGFQSLQHPSDDIYFFERAGCIDSIKCQKATTTSAPLIILKNDINFGNKQELDHNSLYMACSKIKEDTQDIINIIDKNCERWVVPDMRYTVQGILDVLEIGSKHIKDRIGRAANFALLPHHIINRLRDLITYVCTFNDLPCQLRRAGFLNNSLMLYMDASSKSIITMGYRGVHNCDTGIIRATYLEHGNIQNNEETKEYTLFRISEMLLVNPNYYCTIELKR